MKAGTAIVTLMLLVGLAHADEHGYLATNDHGGIDASGPFTATIPAPEGFSVAKPMHSKQRFLGEVLQVSKGGFYDNDTFILIEIETTDAGPGTLNYGHLPTVNFAGRDFHTRVGCFSVTAEEMASNDQPILEYLERHGFQAIPGIWARQLLLVTDDAGGEAGILYASRVNGCDQVSEKFKADFDAEFEAFVAMVRKANNR